MSLRDWLAISRWPGLNIKTIQHLLSGDIHFLLYASALELVEWGLSEKVIENRAGIDWAGVDADLEWATKPQHHIITFVDPQYPPLLRQIARPPILLYIYGVPQTLSKPSLAIVGSRKPSALGKETAYAFAQACTGLGLSVCSGLAYGIDAAAHKGALETGGITLAILGSGLDSIYPRAHTELSQIIAEQGAVISEFPPNTRPQACYFPQRNRIISGLSVGVLVIEAAAQSGSLITAKYAVEQGREVFAVPGSIYNPLSRGCHVLIRQGAKLVESIHDIMEELGGTVDIFANNRQDAGQLVGTWEGDQINKISLLPPSQQALWGLLDDAPSTLDRLLLRSELPAKQLRHELIHLELQGYVKVVSGGYQRCWPTLL